MNRSIRVAVYSIVAIWLVAGPLWSTNVNAQKHEATQRKASPRKKAAPAPQKKYQVGEPLNLDLRHCTGDINLLGGLSGDGLEISGGQVSIMAGGSVAKRGEVIAYAQSQYFLDSNVAFIFDRSDRPFRNAEWKPPVIISLNMIQNRKDPKQLRFTSLPNGNTPVATSVISCGTAGAAIK